MHRITLTILTGDTDLIGELLTAKEHDEGITIHTGGGSSECGIEFVHRESNLIGPLDTQEGGN